MMRPFAFLRPRRAVRPAALPRVLLLWWGTFPDGGDTIGDYHSVLNLASAVAARGVPCDIASGNGLPFGPHRAMPLEAVDPASYSAVAFVCGPLVLRNRVRRLLRTFDGLPRAALAVSIVGPRVEAERWFQRIVERDSAETTRFDLSLADEAPATAARTDPALRRPAVCLRGRQGEYGRGADLSGAADRQILEAAQVLSTDFFRIDTVLSPANTAETIHERYGNASVLLTTRMHGALFALLHRVPFIAVDQIKGGAKVSRLLARVNWPALHTAETLQPGELAAQGRQLLESGWTAEMEAARAAAVTLSQQMLRDCTACLVELSGAR